MVITIKNRRNCLKKKLFGIFLNHFRTEDDITMNLTKIIGDNENIRKYRVTGAMMDKIKVNCLCLKRPAVDASCALGLFNNVSCS